ncbi:MAG: hypothetical protein A2Y41_12715 [Spirochaetes bacterium GWB1_36_13]|nr:MAG: hypothetical protein A2Y41_12715 [Spirochaetes bacterium GWB1_36_13]
MDFLKMLFEYLEKLLDKQGEKREKYKSILKSFFFSLFEYFQAQNKEFYQLSRFLYDENKKYIENHFKKVDGAAAFLKTPLDTMKEFLIQQKERVEQFKALTQNPFEQMMDMMKDQSESQKQQAEPFSLDSVTHYIDKQIKKIDTMKTAMRMPKISYQEILRSEMDKYFKFHDFIKTIETSVEEYFDSEKKNYEQFAAYVQNTAKNNQDLNTKMREIFYELIHENDFKVE